VDEEMAHEVRGIVQGSPSDGHLTGGAPPGMTYEEVEERSRLGRYIPRSSLPGDREELVLGATEMNAPDDIVAMLAGLPAGEHYRTVNEIWAALGHHNEERRT
jgi:hypothetical protein